jgi:hypothetical protein
MDRGVLPVAVDVSIAGRRYGHLVVAYSKNRGRDVACRCVCFRLIHVAAADLKAGIIDSCGCQPASPAFRARHAELCAQQKREITFSIARAR